MIPAYKKTDPASRCIKMQPGRPAPKQHLTPLGDWKGYHSQLSKCLLVLMLLVGVPRANTCSAQVSDSTQVIGALTKCWKVFSHEYTNIYGLEEEEIKRYTKQRICFTPDSASMYLGVVFAPKYSIKKVQAENYSKANFDCPKRKLGILTDSVYEITMSSLSKPSKDGTVHKMTDVIVYDGECIFVVVDGVIFRMFDANSKVRASSAN